LPDTSIDLAVLMAIQRLVGTTVRAGDRVLFVGPRRGRFLQSVPHARPNSRTADTLPTTDVGRFDVVIIVDAASFLGDDDATEWAQRASRLLTATGRLVLATRHTWITPFDFPLGFIPLDAVPDARRLADPLSIFECFTQAGFEQSDELTRWWSSHIVRILVPTPRPPQRERFGASEVSCSA
jgi:hypothetical protein